MAVSRIYRTSFIHGKCRKELRTSAKKYKICLKCKKHLHKAPMVGCSATTVEVDDIILKKIGLFRKQDVEVKRFRLST